MISHRFIITRDIEAEIHVGYTLLLKSCNKYCSHNYRQVSNISHTLVGNEIVDHSDVVGASPVGAAPTTSSFST